MINSISGWASRSFLIPSARFSQTATGISGYFSLICLGSSPIERKEDWTVERTNPRVLRLYPRERTATLNIGESFSIRYSVTGVLPVPPTVRLPTQTIGISNSSLLRMFKSKSLCRILTTSSYIQARGAAQSLRSIQKHSS